MITQGEAYEVIYRQGMYLMLLLMNFISIKPHIIMARKYLYSPFITLQWMSHFHIGIRRKVHMGNSFHIISHKVYSYKTSITLILKYHYVILLCINIFMGIARIMQWYYTLKLYTISIKFLWVILVIFDCYTYKSFPVIFACFSLHE